jgi:hypothetical protein
MNSAHNTNRRTKTNFKSFIKKNATNLLVKVNAEFDSMSDCVRTTDGAWRMVDQSAIEPGKPYTMGIEGVWLVGGGRDWFEHYETAAVIGIRGFNCCGSFTVAIAKQQHAA